MTSRKTMAGFLAAITVCLATTALLTTGATAQSDSQIYGSQLMTQQERFEHRSRMQNAKTAAERKRIRAEHHQNMQERAKKQGVTLPDKTPTQGMRQGRGMGPRGSRSRQ